MKQRPAKQSVLPLMAIALWLGSLTDAVAFDKCYDVDRKATIYPFLCMHMDRLYGDKWVARFSPDGVILHFNVRYQSGDEIEQIDLDPYEPWEFALAEGQAIKFAVQLCEKPFAGTSRCTSWVDLVWPEPQPQPPAAKGPTDKEKVSIPIPGIGKDLEEPGARTPVPSPFQANLALTGIAGPNALKAGLSGTYTVAVKNFGGTRAAVELDIHFAGRLNQTGPITAPGLTCALRPAQGVNATVHCTGGSLDKDAITTVTVQGSGQQAGAGQVIGTLNNSRALKESDYGDNVRQLNVTIN